MDYDNSEIGTHTRFRQVKSLALLFFASFFTAYVLPDDPNFVEYYTQSSKYAYLYAIGFLALAWIILIYQTFFDYRASLLESFDRKLDRYDKNVFSKFSFMGSKFALYSDLCAVMAILASFVFMVSPFFTSFRF